MNMLHLAGPDDAPRLLPLIERFHATQGLDTSAEERETALGLLFSGEVQAAAWLIGPRRAPVGYIALSFGFSIALAGRDAVIDEFYIRENVRRRGMGSQTIAALLPMLREMGVKALHMEAARDNDRVQSLCRRAGFRPRDGHVLMSRTL